jgi:hypothetical protein
MNDYPFLRLLFLLILPLTLIVAGCRTEETPAEEDQALPQTQGEANVPPAPVPVQETVIELGPVDDTPAGAALFSPAGDADPTAGGPIEIDAVGGVPPANLVSEPVGPDVAPETDIEAVRFAIPGVNFELPLGWEAVTLGPDAYVLRPIGAETIFEGPANTSAYIYLRLAGLTDPTKPLGGSLAAMQAGLGGVELAEVPISPSLDGVRSGGQFVDGSTDLLHYRAFLTVIPLTQSQVIELVFWGDDATWTTMGPQMARVLETIRLPEG